MENRNDRKTVIAVVVPTIRPDEYKTFCAEWEELFQKHHVELVTVYDGDNPTVNHLPNTLTVGEVMGKEYTDLIYNKSDVVRNLGFAYVAKYLPEVTHVLTLDDDTRPFGDTIQDHLYVLGQRVPVSWMSTASKYMRGFPYGVRDEAEVMLSHGVWEGVADWDAPTQLIRGNRTVEFVTDIVPRGVFYPMCGMNIMFRRELLSYMYFAPMGYRVGIDRFGDIWCGIESKKVIDEMGWAVVTGYAKVRHERASNVWKNLQKEARGIEMNEVENYGKGEYFEMYANLRTRWYDFVNNANNGNQTTI